MLESEPDPVLGPFSSPGAVQIVLDELVDTGAETGLQVAVYHHGALVVDAVAGIGDGQTGRRVNRQTPLFSFSTGKVMTSLIAHLLVRTGTTPVVELWPEFGAHGKATVTLRHVLTHSVGVPAMPRGLVRVLRDVPSSGWPATALSAAPVPVEVHR